MRFIFSCIAKCGSLSLFFLHACFAFVISCFFMKIENKMYFSNTGLYLLYFGTFRCTPPRATKSAWLAVLSRCYRREAWRLCGEETVSMCSRLPRKLPLSSWLTSRYFQLKCSSSSPWPNPSMVHSHKIQTCSKPCAAFLFNSIRSCWQVNQAKSRPMRGSWLDLWQEPQHKQPSIPWR